MVEYTRLGGENSMYNNKTAHVRIPCATVSSGYLWYTEHQLFVHLLRSNVRTQITWRLMSIKMSIKRFVIRKDR
jgi:hypothetical protein